ncbi:MAG TPA: S8 family serine peptidase, partial [Flavobacteriales bacterium]|nr:S8 family serine peptidase [Flavobacteriales bacterium]
MARRGARSGILIGLLLATVPALHAQTAPGTYLVSFTDKGHTPYTLDHPEAYLSARALERRERQHIALDSLDLPVDPAYVQAVLAAGPFELRSVSKWSNAVTVHTADSLAADTLHELPFVVSVKLLRDGRARPRREAKFSGAEKGYAQAYGDALRQISMMNGHLLQTVGGARGEGMLIGILDAGFDKADVLPAFADLRDRGGVVLTRDIVHPGGNVYAEHWHGRSVLSVMAGHLNGQLEGTAPNADYVLVRTEDEGSEYIVEEDNWIVGAELCDSIGCDVLNTSLGYIAFDDSTQDHTYAQLDGHTTRISIAANIASRKGMLPVNSAGNSGTSAWYHIGAPADAEGILAVGAVDADRQVADFSSRGPSADGRVKPDVSAMGKATIGLNVEGTSTGPINGTSFSSPLLAGLTACLWELHRDRSNTEIMDAIRRSASHFDAPNADIGYGIPDLWRAHLLLGGRDLTALAGAQVLNVMPVPFTGYFDVELFAGNATTMELRLHDATGRLVW